MPDRIFLIDYKKDNPPGWQARMDTDGEIEVLIEGASELESVCKYVWKLAKQGKL